MIPIVMIKGALNKTRLDAIAEELRSLAAGSAGSIYMIIDSVGGKTAPALRFVERVSDLQIESRLMLKIYRAHSVAAFIAVSLGGYREMQRGSQLEFHRGRLELETVDIGPKGEVPTALVKSARRYTTALDKVLLKVGVTDPKRLAEFHAGGWLTFSAEECLQAGLVQRLF